MTFPILAVCLMTAAVLGLVTAWGLLTLKKTLATKISAAVCIGYLLLLFWRPEAVWFSNVSILVAGASLGFLLSLLLGSTGSVLTFLITAGIIDFFSFSDGLTNQIMEAYRTGGSTLLRYLAVFLEVGGHEYAVIGVGDIFLISAAYLGFRRATGSTWAPAFWLLLGLFCALVVGYTLGGAPGIPFLAGGGAVFVLLNRRRTAFASAGRQDEG